MQIVRNVKIIGTGSYVPEKIYSNEYLEKNVDTNAKWIEENLGIKERRIADSSEATSDLAVKAGIKAIMDSALNIEDIDLIIVATATPDRLAPSTAAIVQDKIEAYNAVAFDISAVCSGFLYGMSVASQFIAAGVYDNVLLIGADTFSKITNWKNRDCVFFGDGAGAAVLSFGNVNEGFMAFRLYTDGRGKWNFTIPAGGSENPASEETVRNGLHYFEMNGKAVYETGTKVLPEAIMQVLMDAGLTVNDIDYLIPHQPSVKILKKTAEIIGMPFEKVMTNMHKYANTSGGTIPMLLDEVNKAEKLKKGNNILFAAVGSGWTYGAAILKWS
ncbi:3-oxoacyl-ACP synthase III family protein [Prosthecochloris sp. SCSIO W1103]|uniref:3-oxoacyl-ACP synthase III family protein n=1 Tax=Prosthecochloris sp. SCSIO W1103 TaxID=2992244 RepID=UPI00223D4119|nr:beta-ketoacyl-ACP synthase III [Prosthecochloris sp. SCSIO W1103]UZJ38151.1 ketoacyl-ACP synthase III [Prosthecochloris sp. SCSIO W1103]